MKTVFVSLLTVFAAMMVGCQSPSPSEPVAKPNTGTTVTATRDASDSFVNAATTSSVTTIGGVASNSATSSAVRYITVCDNSVTWDAPNQGANDGDTLITPAASAPAQVRVCSYAIVNGATAQDVQLFNGTSAASSGSGNVCGLTNTQQPYMTYHLGPYQSITRGNGNGVLYSLGAGSGVCIHRKQNGTNPLGVEITIAIN